MSLLTSPLVIETLDNIRTTYCVEAGASGHAIDDFFWLHAHRPSGAQQRLKVLPAYQGSKQEAPVRLCNLVLQGGGTLGLAHAGFVTGLEAAGIRFVGLAGTSAGSILAMGIAAIRGKDITRETYQDLVAITDTAPMDQFIDGPRPLRILIKRALQGKSPFAPQRWLGIVAAFVRMRDRRGLNHGTAFETWFESVLSKYDCGTIDDLYATLDAIWDDLADLRALHLDGGCSGPALADQSAIDPSLSGRPGAALLQLITMAMPIGMKFKLPQDLYYLSPEYQRTSPARLVRTSMSIPAFFEPVVMQTNRETWGHRIATQVSDLLTASQSRQFESLEELVFLDGGMMSNLPSDSFRELMPEVPTIVVPLVHGTAAPEITRRRNFTDLGSDVGAVVSAIRLQRDRETWAQNAPMRAAFDQAERSAPDVKSKKRPPRRYPVEIAPIDTGEANWLNFVMSATEKAALFEAGLLRAQTFLEKLKNGDA